MEERYEQVKQRREERFQPAYGYWRGLVDAVVCAFVDCGNLEHGFARVFCDASGPGALSTGDGAADDDVSRGERRRLRRQWTELIRRIYEADPLVCTCGAPMRLLSFITEPPVVKKILPHLERAGNDPSRAPPRNDAVPAALVS